MERAEYESQTVHCLISKHSLPCLIASIQLQYVNHLHPPFKHMADAIAVKLPQLLTQTPSPSPLHPHPSRKQHLIVAADDC